MSIVGFWQVFFSRVMHYDEFMGNKIDLIRVGDIGTNCWLYPLEPNPASSGKQPCVVIDPGDESSLIISRLRELHWLPRYVFLTHGHYDHVAALPDLAETFREESGGAFPQIGIHRLDAHYLGKDSLEIHRSSMSAAGGSAAYVDALWKALPPADILFEEGDQAGPFKVMHVPGHTQGSVSFYDEKAGVLFSGDTLFMGSWGRTDLPGGNERQLYQSLSRLLSMNGEIVVCPGHGPATCIKDEQRLIRHYL